MDRVKGEMEDLLEDFCPGASLCFCLTAQWEDRSGWIISNVKVPLSILSKSLFSGIDIVKEGMEGSIQVRSENGKLSTRSIPTGGRSRAQSSFNFLSFSFCGKIDKQTKTAFGEETSRSLSHYILIAFLLAIEQILDNLSSNLHSLLTYCRSPGSFLPHYIIQHIWYFLYQTAYLMTGRYY